MPVSPPGEAGAVIELNRLTKRYGDKLAVDSLTVAVPAGRAAARR